MLRLKECEPPVTLLFSRCQLPCSCWPMGPRPLCRASLCRVRSLWWCAPSLDAAAKAPLHVQSVVSSQVRVTLSCLVSPYVTVVFSACKSQSVVITLCSSSGSADTGVQGAEGSGVPVLKPLSRFRDRGHGVAACRLCLRLQRHLVHAACSCSLLRQPGLWCACCRHRFIVPPGKQLQHTCSSDAVQQGPCQGVS